MREERLELQVWLTHDSAHASSTRPSSRDKLIGCAYVDLATLARGVAGKTRRLSGVFPLFKPGSSNLGGSCIRAHLTLKPTSGYVTNSDDDSDTEMKVGRTGSRPGDAVTHAQRENSFAAHISIERAFHLPVTIDDDVSAPPSAYVSYQTAEKRELSYTNVFPHSSNPVWSHEHDTRLPKTLLSPGGKDLVLKVWHKPSGHGSRPNKSSDKVLGFVSVDISPLTRGFSNLCGWYNIMDFNGLCQGQVKVAITPLESVADVVLPLPQANVSFRFIIF